MSFGVYKYSSFFSGLYLNTSPAPQKYFYIIIYLSDTSPAPEKPEKYLYTLLFRRRRSAYIHLSGPGEAGEVFIYTHVFNIIFMHI